MYNAWLAGYMVNWLISLYSEKRKTQNHNLKFKTKIKIKSKTENKLFLSNNYKLMTIHHSLTTEMTGRPVNWQTR